MRWVHARDGESASVHTSLDADGSAPPKMTIWLRIGSHTAWCRIRAGGSGPPGLSWLHVGAPVRSSFHRSLCQVPPKYPPNTSMHASAGSYTAECQRRAGGGVPEGASGVQRAVAARVRRHTR